MPSRIRQVEICESLDVPGLADTWNDLHRAVPQAGLCSSLEWCRCWLETVGQAARPFVAVLRDHRGNPLALAPLCLQRHQKVRWLGFMGRERVSGDHLDLIVRPEDHAAAARVLLARLAGEDGYDGLILGELAPTSPLLSAAVDWAEENEFPWYEREHRRLPFVELPGRFEEFLAGLSGNMRYHVRRRRRGLARHTNTAVELVRGGPRVDEVLADFFELHRLRWERDGLPGNFTDPQMCEFLRRFCRGAARSGGLRIHALCREGRTEGVLIAFHDGSTVSYYQMGWDPRSPVDSPGVLLLAASIEQAVAEGMARYDFLRGDEAYKQRWTPWAAEQTTLVIGCRLAARAAVAADRLKNRLKVAVTRCLGPRSWEKARRLVTGASV
jgi:CelD/BcsL family acetyltransferase involved in cellulose biosynthesis